MVPSRSGADERVERAILALLLAFGEPEERSLGEIVGEIGDQGAVSRSLERLRAVGLVERSGERVWASPAARRFDELSI